MTRKKLYTGAGGIIYSTDSNFNPGEKVIENKTLAPQEQMLKVRLDARNRGGKIVTLIEGFSGTKDDIEQPLQNLFPVISLDYYLMIFYRASSTAKRFYFFTALLIFRFLKNDGGDAIKKRFKQVTISHGIFLLLFLLIP